MAYTFEAISSMDANKDGAFEHQLRDLHVIVAGERFFTLILKVKGVEGHFSYFKQLYDSKMPGEDRVLLRSVYALNEMSPDSELVIADAISIMQQLGERLTANKFRFYSTYDDYMAHHSKHVFVPKIFKRNDEVYVGRSEWGLF